jgi:ribosomal protein S18 acetylase RimI-like enzyme
MTPAGIRIRSANRDDVDGLADVLYDCVESGASVNFLWPFTRERAAAFWPDNLASAARGERIVLVAEALDDPSPGEPAAAEADRSTDARVVGTVQLILVPTENQPHRGEISKMLVHRAARRRGVGEALMRAIEAEAVAAGRTLLVLDTASPDAERLYERSGWHRVGVIPKYALWPDGRYVDTVVFYKDLAPDA